LFDLYDTNNDGYIEKRDMITMLYNYPKNYINFITDELAPDKGEKLAKVGEKQRQSISQIIDDEDKKNRKNSRLPADAEDTIMEDNEVDEAVPADERKTIDLYEMDRDIKTAFETYKQRKKNAANGIPDKSGGLQESHVIMYTPDRNRLKLDENKSRDRQFLSVTKGESKDKNDKGLSDLSSMFKPGNMLVSSSVIIDQSFVQASTVNSRVKEYASFMFKNFDSQSRGKINFSEFKEWLSLHSTILKVFDETFHQSIWALEGKSSNSKFKLRFHNEKPDMSGYLWKHGRKSKKWVKRYFELRGHFMFYYSKKEVEVPNNIYFLEGCYVDEINEYYAIKKYGFLIAHKSQSYKTHQLYCDSKDEYDQWMKHLRVF